MMINIDSDDRNNNNMESHFYAMVRKVIPSNAVTETGHIGLYVLIRSDPTHHHITILRSMTVMTTVTL